MEVDDFIVRVPCKSAEDLVSALSPRSIYFKHERSPHKWIFRGVASEGWKLIPTAFRGEDLTQHSQIYSELRSIEPFFRFADESGLPLPEDSQFVRNRFQVLSDSLVNIHARFGLGDTCKRIWETGEEVWPPDEFLSLIALAQHHGIPTRMLDWSRNPLKAAYFAAVKAAKWIKHGQAPKEEGDIKNLSVWAMSWSEFTAGQFFALGFEEISVLIVTAPRAGNPNLHAQEGLFTVLRPQRVKLFEPVDRRPLDEILRGTETFRQRSRIFYEFKLPIEQSPKLLRLLAQEGIHGAALFPGFDGVVKRIEEEQLWDDETSTLS